MSAVLMGLCCVRFTEQFNFTQIETLAEIHSAEMDLTL